MRFAMLGMGRMGANMTTRATLAGHEVVRYDIDPLLRDADSLREVVSMLEGPRVLWMMLPFQAIIDTLAELEDLLEPGDIVVDGGNSYWKDTQARHEHLKTLGVEYVDCGTSGGIWGLESGYALMVGGDRPAVEYLMPIFDALSPDQDGFVYAGPSGAGHQLKQFHNGAEYALMQAYGELYELMVASDLVTDPEAALRSWRSGSVVRSWMLDLMTDALSASPGLEGIKGHADDSGMGRWTVQDAVDMGVPVPAISASLFARFASRQEESPAMQMVAALRNQFGGHLVHRTAPLAES